MCLPFSLCRYADNKYLYCSSLLSKVLWIGFKLFLVQVPQVTEEIAIAVLDMYPTLVSLASSYSQLVSFFFFFFFFFPCMRSFLNTYFELENNQSVFLKDGNVSAQEEMLRNRSNSVISATASKNIFKLVWAE